MVLNLGRIQKARGAASGDAEYLPDLNGTEHPAAFDFAVHHSRRLNQLAVQAFIACPPIRWVSVDPVLIIHLYRCVRSPGIIAPVDQSFVVIGVAAGVSSRGPHGEPTAIELPVIHNYPDVFIADLHYLLRPGGRGKQHRKR